MVKLIPMLGLSTKPISWEESCFVLNGTTNTGLCIEIATEAKLCFAGCLRRKGHERGRKMVIYMVA